jgi:hypothetical protein
MSILFSVNSWRLWNREGDLLVGTTALKSATRKRTFSRRNFAESKEGQPSYGIYKNV